MLIPIRYVLRRVSPPPPSPPLDSLPGIHRNIISLEFLGFNVFKPRCAIPIGKPCVPLEGPRRRLHSDPPGAVASTGSGRALSGSDDDINVPFDIQVFKREQLIVRISRSVCM
jgi:hypothetical protein